MTTYKTGFAVILKPFEGEPAERAIVIGSTKMPWGISYTVKVTPIDDEDDGLRETDVSQMLADTQANRRRYGL